MTGIGIIGTGTIARFHADAIADIPDARLSAVFDSRPEGAAAFAAAHHCDHESQLDRFLARRDIDVVSICTPSGAHRDAAIAAAAAGKHLCIEKPLEVTSTRCDEIISAVQRSGVVLGTVFQSRFHPSMRLVKRAVDGNWFGNVSLVTAEVKWFRTQEYYDGSGWRGTWALDGGGALMNQSIHVVDLLLWLFGDPESVTAAAGVRTHRNLEVEDTFVGTVAFADGPLGTIAATTGAWPGSFKVLEICGELGHIRVEEDRITRWDFSAASTAPPDAAATVSESDVEDPLEIGSAAHGALYSDLLEAIASGGEPQVGGAEGRAAVRLVERFYAAAGLRSTATGAE